MLESAGRPMGWTMESSGTRAVMLTLLLIAGCSPSPAPIDAQIPGGGTLGKPMATAGVPARAGAAAASRGDIRQRSSDIVVLEGRMRDVRLALRERARVLAAHADGRSQLAAASLLKMATIHEDHQDQSSYAALLVRAGELSPDDPLIAWLERLGCPASEPLCHPAQALTRLQRLEPGNAATWLAALDDAVAGGDQAAIDRALDRAGLADHFDSYWGEAGHFLDATLASVPLPPRSVAVLDAQRRQAGGTAVQTDEDERSIMAMSMASAFATPGLLPLTRNCRGDAIALSASRRSSCLAVAVLLAGSDTLLGRRVGLGLAVRLTADSAAGAAWREQLRRFLWLRELVPVVGYHPPSGYTQSVWRLGEVAALQAWATSTGRPLTPPPGWLPRSPEDRALITTGRPPPRD